MNQKLIDFLTKAAKDEGETIAAAWDLREKREELQYLRLTIEHSFNDLSSGRYTVLERGMTGCALNEEIIATLPGAIWGKKHKMLQELMDAYAQNKIYALVGGYPCPLEQGSYELLDKAPILCIGELV
jgi:hypothetical protein